MDASLLTSGILWFGGRANQIVSTICGNTWYSHKKKPFVRENLFAMSLPRKWSKRFMDEDYDYCDICGRWMLVTYNGCIARCESCRRK